MDPQANGDILEVFNDIPNTNGLDDPLDVVEDLRTGNLYVSEFDSNSEGNIGLTLLRADIQAENLGLSASSDDLIFEVVTNDQDVNTETEQVTISNDGTTLIEISNVFISGPFADQYSNICLLYTSPSPRDRG